MIIDEDQNEPIKCPKCGTAGNFKEHGFYMRYLKTSQEIKRIKIKRLKCCSCKTTHAKIPKNVIPYKQHSLGILSALANDKLKGLSNSKIRTKYKLCESTRYRLTVQALKDVAFSLKTNDNLNNIQKALKNINLTIEKIAANYYFNNKRKFCQNIRLNNPLLSKHIFNYHFP